VQTGYVRIAGDFLHKFLSSWESFKVSDRWRWRIVMGGLYPFGVQDKTLLLSASTIPLLNSNVVVDRQVPFRQLLAFLDRSNGSND
jgi:hypothetical protein